METQEPEKNEQESQNSDGISEAHQELDESKKTVADLVNYRRSLLNGSVPDAEKEDKFKDKAIEAINHLFNDEISSEEE